MFVSMTGVIRGCSAHGWLASLGRVPSPAPSGWMTTGRAVAVDGPGWSPPRRRKPGVRMRIAAVIAGIVTISGCGTDESTAGITLVASETLAKADMEEEMGYALDDDDVTVDAPTITVQTGREVTLTLENRAGQYSKVRASHDFAVVPPLDDQYTDVDMYTDIATLKIDDKVLWGARTPQIFTDDSATTTFVPDAPGTYQYICTIAGHASRGMRGTLIVEDPE
jgi:plastocyanin